MKLASILAAFLALTLFAGIASAKKDKTAGQSVKGEITKIDGANITIQPRVKKGDPAVAPIVVTTSDATTVTVNGDKKALSDLAVAQRVTVTLDADGKSATAFVVGEKGKGKSTPPATTPPAAATPPAADPAK